MGEPPEVSHYEDPDHGTVNEARYQCNELYVLLKKLLIFRISQNIGPSAEDGRS